MTASADPICAAFDAISAALREQRKAMVERRKRFRYEQPSGKKGKEKLRGKENKC